VPVTGAASLHVQFTAVSSAVHGPCISLHGHAANEMHGIESGQWTTCLSNSTGDVGHTPLCQVRGCSTSSSRCSMAQPCSRCSDQLHAAMHARTAQQQREPCGLRLPSRRPIMRKKSKPQKQAKGSTDGEDDTPSGSPTDTGEDTDGYRQPRRAAATGSKKPKYTDDDLDELIEGKQGNPTQQHTQGWPQPAWSAHTGTCTTAHMRA
jgi:hypothetical protein